MKKLFCYMLALVFTTSFANASIIDGANSNPNLYAHTHKIKLEPASSIITLEWQFAPHKNKIARIHWLPDYQDSFGSRSSEGGGTSNQDSSCSAYNSGYVSSPPDASKYDFTTKSNVDGQGLKCYTNLKCKAKFKYNNSNCSGEYQLSGDSCDENYSACVAKPCSAGGYFDTAQADKKCSPITYGGRTCQSCYQPECSEGRFETTKDSAKVCVAQTYYGRTCYTCRNKDDNCSSGSKTACNSDQVQTSTTTTEAGSTCFLCRNKTCAEKSMKDCNGGCIATNTCCGGCASNQFCNNGTCENLCVRNDCSGFKLITPPANATYTTCKVGCGNDTTNYKFNACNGGYSDTKSYWCSAPVTTDCSALGYNMTTTGCVGKNIVKCPFDTSKIFCY